MNNMWVMGQYVAAALDATVCNAMPFVKRKNKGKYPDKPVRVVPLTPEEKKAEEEEALKEFLNFFNSMEAKIRASRGHSLFAYFIIIGILGR